MLPTSFGSVTALLQLCFQDPEPERAGPLERRVRGKPAPGLRQEPFVVPICSCRPLASQSGQPFVPPQPDLPQSVRGAPCWPHAVRRVSRSEPLALSSSLAEP